MKFVPEYIFEHFYDASAEFLTSIGVRGIVLDIDNTLEPYENSKPGEMVLRWFDELKDANIAFSIVSNNNRKRVETFLDEICVPYYYKAKKPFKKNVRNAMNKMNTNEENTILMGDQIFTDIWAAHNCKIRGILVFPIKDKRDVFTRLKRLLEKPIIKKYYKLKDKG